MAEISNSGSYTDYFVRIIHDLSLPITQVKIDAYYFRLLLVLVIPQIETIFVFNLRLHIAPDVTKIICK